VIATALLPPERTALIMIGAERYLARRQPAAPLPHLAAAAALLRDARRAGAHVLHVRRVQDGEDPPEVRLRPAGADPRRGAALAGEKVVDVRGPSPFAEARLDRDLAARGVDAVVIAGVMTPSSCTAVTNEAVARRYRTVVASDLIGESAREAKRRLGAEVLCSASIRGLLGVAAKAA
jgi:nicotinamidase-related amidase